MLLCEQNFRDVWSRNESDGQKLVKFCTLTHAAKLVVEMTQLPAMHGGGVNFVTLGRHRRNEPER